MSSESVKRQQGLQPHKHSENNNKSNNNHHHHNHNNNNKKYTQTIIEIVEIKIFKKKSVLI